MRFYCGQRGSFSKTITEHDVYSFAGITGDFNSVHINRISAEKSIFGRQVVHGCLTSSFISTVLGMYLPGDGTILLHEEYDYHKPVFLGDTITAYVEIIEIVEDKAVLEAKIEKNNKDIVVSGIVKVKLPK